MAGNWTLGNIFIRDVEEVNPLEKQKKRIKKAKRRICAACHLGNETCIISTVTQHWEHVVDISRAHQYPISSPFGAYGQQHLPAPLQADLAMWLVLANGLSAAVAGVSSAEAQKIRFKMSLPSLLPPYVGSVERPSACVLEWLHEAEHFYGDT